MKVKIKKLHENAVIPRYMTVGDAGLDLTAISKSYDEHGNIVYGTGLAFEVPKGFCMLLFPRSSNSRTDLVLSNSVGLVDSGFRGEVLVKFGYYRGDSNTAVYKIGDRVAQALILPYPEIKFEEVEELSQTERQDGSYGSTGK